MSSLSKFEYFHHGYGSGYGSGYSSGDGYGYGYGSGYGNGSGRGDGDGDGDGDGRGDGNDRGDGRGDGNGNDRGDGSRTTLGGISMSDDSHCEVISFPHNIKLKIFYDQDSENPRTNFDPLGTMIGWGRHYTKTGDSHDYNDEQSLFFCICPNDVRHDLETWAELTTRVGGDPETVDELLNEKIKEAVFEHYVMV